MGGTSLVLGLSMGWFQHARRRMQGFTLPLVCQNCTFYINVNNLE